MQNWYRWFWWSFGHVSRRGFGIHLDLIDLNMQLVTLVDLIFLLLLQFCCCVFVLYLENGRTIYSNGVGYGNMQNSRFNRFHHSSWGESSTSNCPPSQLCKRACSYFWESAIRSKIRKSNYANCGASRGADVSFLSFLFVNRLVRILAGPTGTNWIESKRLNSRLDWYNYANRKVMNWNPIYHVNKVSFKRPSEGI